MIINMFKIKNSVVMSWTIHKKINAFDSPQRPEGPYEEGKKKSSESNPTISNYPNLTWILASYVEHKASTNYPNIDRCILNNFIGQKKFFKMFCQTCSHKQSKRPLESGALFYFGFLL